MACLLDFDVGKVIREVYLKLIPFLEGTQKNYFASFIIIFTLLKKNCKRSWLDIDINLFQMSNITIL